MYKVECFMLIKTEIIFLPRNRLLTCCLQRITLNISDITIGKGRLISASAASSFISNTSCLRCIVRLSGIYENNGIALPAWESILEALTWTLPKKKKPHTNVVRFWCSLQLLFLALSMIFRIIQVQLHFLSILFMFMTFTRETRTHHKI